MKNKLTMNVRLISLCLALCFVLSACSSANNGSPQGSDDSENQSDTSGGFESESESDTQGGIYDNTEVDPGDTENDGNTEDGGNTEDPGAEEDENLWANRMVANVKSVLNVRKAPDADAAIVGKMDRGAVGIVVEKGTEWTKIISGTVEGYVSTAYCLFGEEAQEKVTELSEQVAVVNGNKLRLRDAASSKGHVMTKLNKGEILTVNTSAKTTEGWVAVYYGDGTYYLSADYVTLTAKEKTALTTAEAKAQKLSDAKLKDKQEEQLLEAKQQIAMEEASDLEFLATIIWCESGAEPYEAQLAVGAVVMNRVESKRYPNDIKKVIVQKSQFSPVGSGWFVKALMRGDASESCYRAAKAAMAGEDNTNGCIGFRLASTGRPGIIYGKIVFF